MLNVTYRNNGVVTIENLAGTNIFNGSIFLFQGGNSFTVQSDAGSLIVFTATNQYVGALSGNRTNYFTGTGNHLVIGSILDSTNFAPISLVKSGSGKLTLAGVNTYGNSTLASNTTATVLSGGTLIVDGVLPLEPFSIASGTTLGGNGIIQAAVTLPSTATLSPGDNSGIALTNSNNGGIFTNNNNSVGILTVSNSVTLQGGSACLFEIDKSSAVTNDQLRVTGTLALGGTLTVTNLGVPLTAGDSFKLFSGGNITGNFSAVNLPLLGTGLAWNTNALTNGILSVVATVPPQFGPMAQTGDGNFQFSGTGAAGVTYELDAATNLSLPILWLFVTNAVADQNGQFQLWDLSATNFTQRFYRITSSQ